jgi:hypothetical protein
MIIIAVRHCGGRGGLHAATGLHRLCGCFVVKGGLFFDQWILAMRASSPQWCPRCCQALLPAVCALPVACSFSSLCMRQCGRVLMYGGLLAGLSWLFSLYLLCAQRTLLGHAVGCVAAITPAAHAPYQRMPPNGLPRNPSGPWSLCHWLHSAQTRDVSAYCFSIERCEGLGGTY